MQKEHAQDLVRGAKQTSAAASATANSLPEVVTRSAQRKRQSSMSAVPGLAMVLREVLRELGLSMEEGSESASQAVTDQEIKQCISLVERRLGFELNQSEREEIATHVEIEKKPFGILQDLIDDPSVSDIIVTNYSKIAVQIGRQNFNTGVSFLSQEMYEQYVERLCQKAGMSCSTKKPIVDGMLGSFARIHVVHQSLCDGGPYLTIRLNRFSSVTTSQLVEHGFAPEEIFSYLSASIRCGCTVLVVGEVATGKTTLVRALASSIPHHESIVVIEDTPEIRLEHPQVRYVSTREENSDGMGRVSPGQCIRGGMRMAMNRIIFGEMRDAEAAEAFVDVCASGHPGLSTIHARSAPEALTRLELFLGRAQRGVERRVLAEQMTTAVQIIVFVDICRSTSRRRIIEVREVGPVGDGVIRQREIFKYQCDQGVPYWKVSNRVSAHRERLEAGEQPVVLSSYPATVGLKTEALFKEASSNRPSSWSGAAC